MRYLTCLTQVVHRRASHLPTSNSIPSLITWTRNTPWISRIRDVGKSCPNAIIGRCYQQRVSSVNMVRNKLSLLTYLYKIIVITSKSNVNVINLKSIVKTRFFHKLTKIRSKTSRHNTWIIMLFASNWFQSWVSLDILGLRPVYFCDLRVSAVGGRSYKTLIKQ